MKKSFSLLFAFVMLFGLSRAQSIFQGTLTYEMKLTGDGMEAYQAMMPTAIKISVLKNNSLIEYEGGMFAAMLGRMLTDSKKGLTYMIRDNEETVYVMDPAKMQEEAGVEDMAAAEPQITKEDEIVEIAGYQCQKYKVVQMGPMGEQTSYVWVSDKFKMPESNSKAASSLGGGMVNVKGLPGLPLKIMTEQGPMTIVLNAKNVDLNAPNKKDFKLPKNYKKEPFDAGAMMGGMGM